MTIHLNPDQLPRPDPREQLEWGRPSYLDRVQELDNIIQHTPIGERATSPACQEAYAELKRIQCPRFHLCTVCGTQFGNDKTRIKDDGSNLYGLCPRCKTTAEV